MRASIGSFLISAAIVATACGTQSPASPTAAVLHGGDSHQGGGDHGGNSGSNGGSNNGSSNGSNHGGDDGGAAATSHESEFTGLVTAVGSNSITVGGQKITVDSSTRITSEDKTLALADIKVGNRVEVKATVSGTTVTATRIQVEDAEDNEPGDDNPPKPNAGVVEVNGTIATIGAGCPIVTLTVGTTKVTTSATTMFEDTTCAALSVGDHVEVKGTLQSNGIVAATSVERE